MELAIDTLSSIAQCSPGVAETWLAPLSASMRRFDIQSGPRAAAFLAQVIYESDGLTPLSENLHYSARRLVAVWPTHFYLPPDVSPGRNDASEFVNRPEALANLIYANRMGNGPPESGDGWRYRGRGLIQLTGRSNYSRATHSLGIDLINDPDLLFLETHAATLAGWYWSMTNCNTLADLGSESSFEAITIAINGQLTGIDERRDIWSHAKVLLATPNS